jgi:hypothetical protein
MQESDGVDQETISLEKRMEELAPVLTTLPKGTHVACIQDRQLAY